jgi:hypothetical protein
MYSVMPGMNVKIDRAGLADGRTVQQVFAAVASRAADVRGVRFESPSPNVLVLTRDRQMSGWALGPIGYFVLKPGNLTIVGEDTLEGAEITASGTADFHIVNLLDGLLAAA